MIYTRGSIQSCKTILRGGLVAVWVVLVSLVEALDQENIMAAAGHSVVLPCRAPSNMTVLAVQWYKRGLEGYVLCFRDDHLDPDEQDASYKDRTDLQDKHLPNGDLSLLLMNVTAADGGTYECVAFRRGGRRRKRDSEVFSVVKLKVTDVTPSDHRDGNRLRLPVLLPVVVVVVMVAGFFIYKRTRRNIGSSHPGQYEMTSQ